MAGTTAKIGGTAPFGIEKRRREILHNPYVTQKARSLTAGFNDFDDFSLSNAPM